MREGENTEKRGEGERERERERGERAGVGREGREHVAGQQTMTMTPHNYL